MDPLAILTASRASEPEHHPRPLLWVLIVAVLALMAVAISVLGPASGPVPEPRATVTSGREARVYTVAYRFGVFSPTNLRIHVGDTVRFRNDATLPVRIAADSRPDGPAPAFDSAGLIPPGGVFSNVFATMGIFGYHNYADENQTGTIIVRE